MKQKQHLNIQTHEVPFQSLFRFLFRKKKINIDYYLFFEKIFKKNIYPESMIKSLLK